MGEKNNQWWGWGLDKEIPGSLSDYFSLMLGKPRITLNNLKTSLRFPCLGLNSIIDSINLPLLSLTQKLTKNIFKHSDTLQRIKMRINKPSTFSARKKEIRRLQPLTKAPREKILREQLQVPIKNLDQLKHRLPRDNQRDWQQQTHLKSLGGNRV